MARGYYGCRNGLNPGFVSGLAARLYWPLYVRPMELLVAAAEAPERDTALTAAGATGWWEQALEQAVWGEPVTRDNWAAF